MLKIGHPKVQVTDYAILKAYGFSPAKAAEVVIDANRGDEHAKRFVELAREYVESKEAL